MPGWNKLPPPYAGRGRPRVKGAKRPTPEPVVATAPRTRWHVAWYGGGRRAVATVRGTGGWYHEGHGLVAVRWLFVPDGRGKRDVAFADAITAVRRWRWRPWVCTLPGSPAVFEKLPRPFRERLLHALAPAA